MAGPHAGLRICMNIMHALDRLVLFFVISYHLIITRTIEGGIIEKLIENALLTD
jgi:hypothetical protein